jgi:uncharacterized protein YeaO (DUF488 family)
MKEIAPSDEFRHWFGHDPARWEDFLALYRRELAKKEDLLSTRRKMNREVPHYADLRRKRYPPQ